MEYIAAMFHLANPDGCAMLNSITKRRPSPYIPAISHGLWSLWDMLRFYADGFLSALYVMQTFKELAEAGMGKLYQSTTPEFLVSKLDWLIAQCTVMGLATIRRKAGDLRYAVEHPSKTDLHSHAKLMAKYIDELRERFEHELDGKAIYFFGGDTSLLDGGNAPFGDHVANHFPSAQYDAEEAGKCLALQRSTACVMHLMSP
jgi:hypothetical protein